MHGEKLLHEMWQDASQCVQVWRKNYFHVNTKTLLHLVILGEKILHSDMMSVVMS